MTYHTELSERAAALVTRKTMSRDIDIADVFSGLDWCAADANDTYFGQLIAAKVVTAKAVTAHRNKGRHNFDIAAQLGGCPADAEEMVALAAKQLNSTVNWQGILRVDGHDENIVDFSRRMRMLNTRLDLGFGRADVDDAAEQYYSDGMKARPVEIDRALSTRRAFDWDAFASSYFCTTEVMSHGLIVATLQKFIHQVRRKLRGDTVAHHIMPVIYGRQGTGKTYLMRKMLAPIDEAVAWSDFDQLTDNRNIHLLNRLVIVLDEMSKAAKADVETVKHVITADTLDRRPMCSNHTIPIANRATMLGASNHRIDDLIRDETGNRRFVELVFNANRDPAAIDRFDFAAMWSSIQPEDADPMAAYRDELVRAQAKCATIGPVEDWLLHAPGAHWTKTASTDTLYEDFKSYRVKVTAGIDYHARDRNKFSRELRELSETRPEYAVTKTRKGTGFVWTREKTVEQQHIQDKADEVTGNGNISPFPRGRDA